MFTLTEVQFDKVKREMNSVPVIEFGTLMNWVIHLPSHMIILPQEEEGLYTFMIGSFQLMSGLVNAIRGYNTSEGRCCILWTLTDQIINSESYPVLKVVASDAQAEFILDYLKNRKVLEKQD